MIDFHKNKLINEVLIKYYETFSLTLDTCDYVPENFNNKIHKYIYKNMLKKFKEIDKDDRKYQKIKRLKELAKQPKKERKFKLFFNRKKVEENFNQNNNTASE